MELSMILLGTVMLIRTDPYRYSSERLVQAAVVLARPKGILSVLLPQGGVCAFSTSHNDASDPLDVNPFFMLISDG